MTTVVNAPGDGSGGGVGLGLIAGIILTIAVVALLVIFGLPMLRGNQQPAQNDTIDVNVKLPVGDSASDSEPKQE